MQHWVCYQQLAVNLSQNAMDNLGAKFNKPQTRNSIWIAASLLLPSPPAWLCHEFTREEMERTQDFYSKWHKTKWNWSTELFKDGYAPSFSKTAWKIGKFKSFLKNELTIFQFTAHRAQWNAVIFHYKDSHYGGGMMLQSRPYKEYLEPRRIVSWDGQKQTDASA